MNNIIYLFISLLSFKMAFACNFDELQMNATILSSRILDKKYSGKEEIDDALTFLRRPQSDPNSLEDRKFSFKGEDLFINLIKKKRFIGKFFDDCENLYASYKNSNDLKKQEAIYLLSTQVWENIRKHRITYNKIKKNLFYKDVEIDSEIEEIISDYMKRSPDLAEERQAFINSSSLSSQFKHKEKWWDPRKSNFIFFKAVNQPVSSREIVKDYFLDNLEEGYLLENIFLSNIIYDLSEKKDTERQLKIKLLNISSKMGHPQASYEMFYHTENPEKKMRYLVRACVQDDYRAIVKLTDFYPTDSPTHHLIREEIIPKIQTTYGEEISLAIENDTIEKLNNAVESFLTLQETIMSIITEKLTSEKLEEGNEFEKAHSISEKSVSDDKLKPESDEHDLFQRLIDATNYLMKMKKDVL